MRKCKCCGSMVTDDMFYCLNCGHLFERTVDRDTKFRRTKEKTEVYRNKWIALFLCFFFGMFGIHRFYEGKVFSGLLYMFTFGFLGFGWILDIIRILMKPNPYRTS